jgi:hypothetical protein
MRYCTVLLFVLIAVCSRAQSSQPVPERIVSINCENRRIDDVLRDIGAQAKVEFVWSTQLFDASKTVSLHEKNITIRRAIFLLFGNTVTYKVRGNYIMLQPAPAPIVVTPGETGQRKREYTLSGYIIDEQTGLGISYASVYDSVSLASTLSDYYGFYTLKLDGSTQPVNLKVRREYYSDTTFSIVPSSNLTHDIIIHRTPPPVTVVADTIPKTDSAVVAKEQNIEDFPFIDSLIGFEQLMQSRNMKEFLKRNGQVSLLPFVSTNGKLTGNVVNKFSVNVIGGYTGGTNGLEIGTVFNIDRQDVKGVQLAGAANVVGGNVKGIQAAGGLNFTMGSFRGLQLSGGTNILMDTLRGVQLAGGLNINRGKIYGGQMAGGLNVALNDLDFQLAGGLNFVKGNVRKLQVAGGANATWDTLKGLQLAGGYNFARYMNGTQISFVNVAQKSRGLQIGFINIIDTCDGGVPVGFLNLVKNGLHQVEFAVSYYRFVYMSVAVRIGVPAFHNIFVAGIYPAFSIWTFGYGIGHDFRLAKKFNLNLDGYVQHYNHDFKFSTYVSEWTRIDLLFEWKPERRFGIAAGPVLNYFIVSESNWHARPLFRYENLLFTGKPSNKYRDYGWVSIKLAIRLF